MKTKEMVILALLTSILVVCQVGIAFLPNIELVSLLIIIYTMIYRKKIFLVIYAFVLIEGFLYGFGLWWFCYLYIWSILAIIVLLLKDPCSAFRMAIIAGSFGLAFGFLCSLPYFLVGKWSLGLSYFISGIPFDILHCVGNFLITMLLYTPIYRILIKLNTRINY